MKYLSLCLPTNGIAEWVFPVIDNIYSQNVDNDQWELIVTDNGGNGELSERMYEYTKRFSNLIYHKTEAYMFENQIEALKYATGAYLKFINHRSILEPGAIQWMIDIVKKNMSDKPIIYLSNGALRYKTAHEYDSFDGFVRGLRQFASWTTGVGVWREDFEKIPENWVYNKISPHSDVLFWNRDRDKYIIDDHKWCHDIDESHSQKGHYDLYRAFACDEIAITLNLFLDGSISADTLKYIIKCYEQCVAEFYLLFNIFHRPCSYALDGFNDSMGIFLNKRRVVCLAVLSLPKMVINKLKGK